MKTKQKGSQNIQKNEQWQRLKKSGASRKFVYYNDEVDALIKKYTSNLEVESVSDPVKLDVYEKLKIENEKLLEENKELNRLKKENKKIQSNYDKLKVEYELLEKQMSQVCQQKGLI